MQEKNIIDAIKAGDEQAMQKIICRYSRLLWSIVGAVLSQVGTTEDMEECVADVFIDLWEHPQKYDESRGGLKAWLSVIARNKAIDRYRQKTKIQTTAEMDTAAKRCTPASAMWMCQFLEIARGNLNPRC